MALESFEASLKADLREKQQQEEWFRSFLTQAAALGRAGCMGLDLVAAASRS